jgi:putative exosortase-associated protein (TIGR04073 family)
MKNKSNRSTAILAFAMATLVVSMVPSGSRADTVWHKLGRGFAAMATPFLELPGNIIDTNEREGPVAAWSSGVARGIGMTIVRPAVGLYEVVTAPIAAPMNYEPILEPEYPWSYFGEGEHSKFAKSVRDRDSKVARTGKGSKIAKR